MYLNVPWKRTDWLLFKKQIQKLLQDSLPSLLSLTSLLSNLNFDEEANQLTGMQNWSIKYQYNVKLFEAKIITNIWNLLRTALADWVELERNLSTFRINWRMYMNIRSFLNINTTILILNNKHPTKYKPLLQIFFDTLQI